VRRRHFLRLGALSVLGAHPAFAAVPAPIRNAVRTRGLTVPLALDILGAPDSLGDGIDFGTAEMERTARPRGLHVERVAAGMEATASLTRTGFRVGSRTEMWTILPSPESLAPAFGRWLAAAGFRRVFWVPPGGAVEPLARKSAEAAGVVTVSSATEADLLFLSVEPATLPLVRPTEAPPRAALAVAWVPVAGTVPAGTFHPAVWPPGNRLAPDAVSLHRRFEAAFGRAFDSHAWVGWLSTKAVVEAALLARTADPVEVRSALAAARLDGHKGRPLLFEERRLVQPVYVMGPEVGGAGGRSIARGELDLTAL
jgi:hypothetical protein